MPSLLAYLKSRHVVYSCDNVDTLSRLTIYGEVEMAKVSKASAPVVEDMGVMEGRYGQLDGYTVGFESFKQDVDATPLFRGLPDDRCQSPHWGYVQRGRVTFRYADR